MHVFGQWEKARVPGKNPDIHGENMQTPHRKNQLGFEPGSLLLKDDSANLHTTVQPDYDCIEIIWILIGLTWTIFEVPCLDLLYK